MPARIHPIDRYCRTVVDGAIPAGKYHRLACARHLRDRSVEATRAFPYRLDFDRADRFLDFGRKLRHYKGEWAGQTIVWRPYQVFRLGSLFGWIHTGTGLRRFRHAYHELPRKQGKSLEAAVVALYATFFDGEPGAEGYCAATKRDQAGIVFGDGKQLIDRSGSPDWPRGLKDRIRIFRSNLYAPASASKLEPLGADEDSLDGLNPHVVILDEMHKYKTRGTLDVLETAVGARRQPILYKITTAGDDLQSVCGDEHNYACALLERTLVDEGYFAFIAHADPEDDWTLEATAKKANPNYGISVSAADLQSKVLKARGIPAAAASYQQKHLNRWINALAPWLSVDGWRAGQSTPGAWSRADLAGRPCWVGIDLAAKLDLTAMMALFPPRAGETGYKVLRWIWTPADTAATRAHLDRAPYPRWIADGVIRPSPGTSVDHGLILEALRELRSFASITRIGFDPWHADQLIVQLQADGLGADQVLEVPQTYQGMSAGCLELQAAVVAGAIDAQADPCLTWAVGNAVVQSDNKGNIYPVKKRSRGRIDPVMALGIAFSLAIRPAPVAPTYQLLVYGRGRAPAPV